MASKGEYVVTAFPRGDGRDYQRSFASRAAAEAAALRLKRERGDRWCVSVDYAPPGGPFCPIPELSDAALAAAVAAEAG